MFLLILLILLLLFVFLQNVLQQEYDYPGLVDVRANPVLRAEFVQNIAALHDSMIPDKEKASEAEIRYLVVESAQLVRLNALYVLFLNLFAGQPPEKQFFKGKRRGKSKRARRRKKTKRRRCVLFFFFIERARRSCNLKAYYSPHKPTLFFSTVLFEQYRRYPLVPLYGMKKGEVLFLISRTNKQTNSQINITEDALKENPLLSSSYFLRSRRFFSSSLFLTSFRLPSFIFRQRRLFARGVPGTALPVALQSRDGKQLRTRRDAVHEGLHRQARRGV